jgi:PadR family transcriptional regulator AphA
VPQKASSLSPGEWAVLGLLVEGPRHGFTLVKTLAPGGAIGQIWSLPGPLVYRALSTLQTKGLATAVGAERSELGPKRLLIAPTAEGRDWLVCWLSDPVEHVRDIRSLLMLKLALGERLGHDPAPLLRAQTEHFRALLDSLERRAKDIDPGFDRALNLWRMESARAAVRFLELAPSDLGSRSGDERRPAPGALRTSAR